MIVDLVLRFNQSLTENHVMSTLKTAAVQGKFGTFNVDPNSIKLTPPSTTSSSPTSTGGTQGMVTVLFHIYFWFCVSKFEQLNKVCYNIYSRSLVNCLLFKERNKKPRFCLMTLKDHSEMFRSVQ